MRLSTRLAFILIVLISAGLAGSSYGQNSAFTRSSMVGLPGVAVVVDSLSEEMNEKGMTAGVFKVAIELTLMEAGIPLLDPESEDPVPGSPTLLLGITALFDKTVEQCVYSIRLELTQTIHLERDPEFVMTHVPTWSVGGVGFYGNRWRVAIMDDVLGFTDEFVNAFTEANPVIEQ